MTTSRTLIAAVLMTGALAAVLLGWFGSGWRGVEREQRALELSARASAEDGAAEAAAALTVALEQLRVDESGRPYFHYQNLFHDPRGASEGWSVVPSPLASGPSHALVAAHFQIDGVGAITSPTDNLDVPETANPAAADRMLLADLGRLKGQLMQQPDPVQVAMATPRPIPAAPVYEEDKSAKVAAYSPKDEALFEKKPIGKKPSKAKVREPEPQVVVLDPEAYAQNSRANEVFVNAKAGKRTGKPVAPTPDDDVQRDGAGDADDEPAPQAVQRQRVEPPPSLQHQQQHQQAEPPPLVAQLQLPAPAPVAARPRPRPRPTPPPAPAPVTITVSPLAWRAATVEGQPALLALRRVTTPDGTLTQGIVVSSERAREWLAERAPDATLALAAPAGPSAPVALGSVGWWVAVDDTAARAAAADASAALESGFLGRFIPISLLAAACALMVVLLTARAEKLAQQRARFAAAAAHELRTPLAGIQLYGDMLVDGLGDPTKHKDYARRVAEEASRLGRVVANVLGFSQLERRSLAVRPEAGDLVGAVRDVIERSEPGLTRAGATVELEAPAQVSAHFDRDALARIVGNLLDNAEKYTREHDDRRITVTVRVEGPLAMVEVVDRGPGLPASLRRRRFQPFARGTGDDGPPGLGLGLALSQSLARAMGGDLGWRDQARGAAFIVTVPAADPAA